MYIAVRLSGGDPLKWFGSIAGKQIRDLQDLPRPLLAPWLNQLEALHAVEQHERALSSGMLTPESVASIQREVEQLKERAGCTTRLDPEFARFWKAYSSSKPKMKLHDTASSILPDGRCWTGRDARLLRLRNEIKASLARLRAGVA